MRLLDSSGNEINIAGSLRTIVMDHEEAQMYATAFLQSLKELIPVGKRERLEGTNYEFQRIAEDDFRVYEVQ